MRKNGIGKTTAACINLRKFWNLISLPFNETKAKTTIKVRNNSIEYTWAEATTGADPIILGFIYGWNRINQMYMLFDTFVPGNSYWMYAYKDCILKKGGS